MPPETIAGFVLERMLGKGAHGLVWLARGRDGAQVALKILKPELLADAAARRRFEREARAAIALAHPNVVRTIEAGTWQGCQFLVSEYVLGGSLQDLLDRERRLDERRARELALGILRGLAAIHRAGFVHRDLKPANVLLGDAFVPKLADLGLARSTAAERTRLTADDEVVGTPAYLAPEQIEHGTDVDIRADLYSLGAMLYQVVTGDVPFACASALGMLEAHLHAPVPDPTDRVPLAPDFAALIMRLLSKRREERPRDPEAASALLESRRECAQTLPDFPASPEPSSLRMRDDQGATLFIHGGDELVFGRESVPGDPKRICVRVLPAAANIERSLRISNRHLGVVRRGGGWYAHDLNSTHGTTVDGKPLAPGIEVELAEGTSLVLAGVLTLRAALVPPAPWPEPDRACAPTLLFERLDNGTHHRYLCVGAAVSLDLTLRPVGVGAGPWVLGRDSGRLRWLASGPSAAAIVTPRSIEPEDSKS